MSRLYYAITFEHDDEDAIVPDPVRQVGQAGEVAMEIATALGRLEPGMGLTVEVEPLTPTEGE